MRINLTLSFLVTLFLTLLAPALFPSFRLLFFAPFLVISFYQKPRVVCLWYALLTGAVVDLLGSHTPLGLYSLNYCLTTIFVYKWQRHFFADSLSTLFLMTTFFSITSTAVQTLLLFLFAGGISLSFPWVFSDLLLMPALDGLMAFTLFTLPTLMKKRAYDHSFS